MLSFMKKCQKIVKSLFFCLVQNFKILNFLTMKCHKLIIKKKKTGSYLMNKFAHCSSSKSDQIVLNSPDCNMLR